LKADSETPENRFYSALKEMSQFACSKRGVTMKKMMAALALMGACVLAHADGSNWRFFAAVGLGSGGETITSGTITTIGTNRVIDFEVKPGDGVQYRVGVDYRIAGRLTLQGSIGYGVNDPMGMNGSLTFTTIPVEFLGFVNLTDALRIGGGLRNSSAEMKGTGLAAGWSGNGTYTSTPGSVLEAQYLAKLSSQRSQFGISLRYVAESFTHNSVTFNGNHYEIGAALYY
jgi:hypothetical protein